LSGLAPRKNLNGEDKSTLSGIPTGQAMITDFQVLSLHETLGRAIQPILNNMQTDVPVVEDRTVVVC